MVTIRITDWIRIATVVRRALAEVCTVPVLLVHSLNAGCLLALLSFIIIIIIINIIISFLRHQSVRTVFFLRYIGFYGGPA